MHSVYVYFGRLIVFKGCGGTMVGSVATVRKVGGLNLTLAATYCRDLGQVLHS